MMDQKAFLLALLLALLCTSVLGLSLWLQPDPAGMGTHTQLGLEPCGYYVRSGQPCMSCGMTTSFANMARARVVPAWKANPMGIALFLLTLATPIYLVRCMIRRTHPFHLFDTLWGRWLPAVVVVLILFTWVTRHGWPRSI